jgi:site-specific DNA-methyltransferase (adenine-specific)
MKLSSFIREQLSHPKRIIVVGNPPYQKGAGRLSTTLYHKFIEAAQEFAEEVLFVIPSRWYAGGKGLDGFRKATLTEGHVYQLRDFADARAIFPNVDISGGVCFLHWKKDYTGLCNWTDDQGNKVQRDLAEYDVLVRDLTGREILKKVLAKHPGPFLNSTTLQRKPFGPRTTDRYFDESQMTALNGSLNLVPCLTARGKMLWVEAVRVDSNQDAVGLWKVVTAAAGAASGRAGNDGKYNIIGNSCHLLPPGTVCTETFLVLFSSAEEIQATVFLAYLRTRFAQFLLSLRATMNLSASSFSWVPLLDFTQSWDDAKLAVHFGLTPEEVAYIESKIK